MNFENLNMMLEVSEKLGDRVAYGNDSKVTKEMLAMVDDLIEIKMQKEIDYVNKWEKLKKKAEEESNGSNG